MELMIGQEFFSFFPTLNLPHIFYSSLCFITDKLRRHSKYEEEFSDGQHLGINERELHSMNKHIPGK